MLRSRWRLVALVLALGLVFACAATLLSPQRYLARGGVLLPSGMMKAQFTAADPQTAAALVQGFIQRHKNPLLIDPPLVVSRSARFQHPYRPGRRRSPSSSACCCYGAGGSPAVRSENELDATLGVPLLAARPLAAQDACAPARSRTGSAAAARSLPWSARRRATAARASPPSWRAPSRPAASRRSLIDADFRSPALHRAFGLRNRAGLADFLEGRRHRARPLRREPLGAGRGALARRSARAAEPPRMQDAARRRGASATAWCWSTRRRRRAVRTCSCSAAFCGGALVVVEASEPKPRALERLRDLLACLQGARGRHRPEPRVMDDRGYVAQALFDRLSGDGVRFRILGDSDGYPERAPARSAARGAAGGARRHAARRGALLPGARPAAGAARARGQPRLALRARVERRGRPAALHERAHLQRLLPRPALLPARRGAARRRRRTRCSATA